MSRSAIGRLPQQLRQRVAELRSNGAMIAEIQAELVAQGVRISRSAVGRYTRKLDAAEPLNFGVQFAAIRAELALLSRLVERLAASIEESNTYRAPRSTFTARRGSTSERPAGGP